MSGQHTGGPNPEKWSLSGSGGNGFGLSRTLSQGSSGSQGKPYQERCVDPVEPPSVPMGTTHKANPRDANGKEAEIQDFLPVPAEPSSRMCTCGHCFSVASCRTFMCNILTCGLYRLCRRVPCLAPAESQSQETKGLRSAPSLPSKDQSASQTLQYTDIYFRGVKVDPICLDDEPVDFRPPRQEQPRPLDLHKSGSVYLDEFIPLDEWSDDGVVTNGGVDSLISRKLLELYSQFQIDELAKCTSDSVFLKRTSEISRLISDIVREHNLEEQDAECRLVHGIIRLSTRKSKKRPPVRRNETPTDSGTETMKGSFSLTDSNYNDLDVQISKETSSDVLARQMRHNSNRANSSSSPTTFSPAYRETDTESSGLPLLHRYPHT